MYICVLYIYTRLSMYLYPCSDINSNIPPNGIADYLRLGHSITRKLPWSAPTTTAQIFVKSHSHLGQQDVIEAMVNPMEGLSRGQDLITT